MAEHYIEWELENTPTVYDKPRVNEFLDRQTLRHIISNINLPEGVDRYHCEILNEVAESVDLAPFFTFKQLEDFYNPSQTPIERDQILPHDFLCRNCGWGITRQNLYCSHCGTKVRWENASTN